MVAAPAALAEVWLLDRWVVGGKLPRALPVIALVVLLINLLAAGSTSFPGVFLTAWVLVALALAQGAVTWTWRPGRVAVLGVLALSLLLAVASTYTQLTPVVTSAAHLDQAERLLHAGRREEAEAALRAAATEDPCSPLPWQHLAEVKMQEWLVTQSPQDWEQFSAASAEYARRDSRHQIQFTQQGNWRLLAWRKTGNSSQLEAAIDAYRQAVAWYPSKALLHAQLAWALHLAQRADQAAAAAQTAIQLDALNPHREQKLDQQTIYDPQVSPTGAVLSSDPSAELIVRRLRSTHTRSGPESTP
jgi:tetratricopeptide (TPR) repeat protein